MKISRRIGRMALEAVGTAPRRWQDDLFTTAWEMNTSADYWADAEYFRPSNHCNTLLCLIASISGVKP